MAVDGAPPAQAVFEGEEGWAFPVEEALLDGVAVGMLTDAASCRVMAEAYSFSFLLVMFLDFALLEFDPHREREFDFRLQRVVGFLGFVEVSVFGHLLYVVRFKLRRRDRSEDFVKRKYTQRYGTRTNAVENWPRGGASS